MEGKDAARRADEFVETYESKYRDYAGAALQRLYAEGAAIRHELEEPLEEARSEYEQHLNNAATAISSMSLTPEEIHSIKVRKSDLQARYRSLSEPAMRLDGFLAKVSSLTITAIEAEIEEVDADIERDMEVVNFYDRLLEDSDKSLEELDEEEAEAEHVPVDEPEPRLERRRGLLSRFFGRG